MEYFLCTLEALPHKKCVNRTPVPHSAMCEPNIRGLGDFISSSTCFSVRTEAGKLREKYCVGVELPDGLIVRTGTREDVNVRLLYFFKLVYVIK